MKVGHHQVQKGGFASWRNPCWIVHRLSRSHGVTEVLCWSGVESSFNVPHSLVSLPVTVSSNLIGLNHVLVAELLFTSMTKFLTALVLILHLTIPRSTSGCDFPSAPTYCSSVCCTVLLTVTTPFVSFSDNMDKLLTTHPNSLFLICSDFNCHHATWLGVGTSLTSHAISAKDFLDSMGLTRSVNLPTQISPNGKSSLLDLVITSFPTNVSCSSSAPIGSSDHVLVKANISRAFLFCSLAFHSG